MTTARALRAALQPRSRDTWLFWCVAVLVLGTGLGLRDPWPADEPRFALVARQMVESGQWMFPMRGNELYPDKPPLFMWMQATLLWLTGELRIAFLAPSLLASLGTLALARDLARRLWTPEAGAHAAWALLFAVQFTFQGKRAQIDPTLTFFVTLSMYGLLRHLLRGPDVGMWMLGWLAAGLGVITKGVGVIALLVLLPAAWALRRGWPGLTHVRPRQLLWGLLALLVPVVAWLVPMLWTVHTHGDPALHAYADNILFRQTAQRYANAWHHHRPWWYFGGVIAVQWFPVALALPWAVPRWREALRARDARVLLLLGWVLLVVLFFSISPGKREVYILPALPATCVLLGPSLASIVARTGPRRLAFGSALLFSLVLAAAGGWTLLGEPPFERALAETRGLAGGTAALGALLAAVGSAGLAALAWCRMQKAVTALLLTLGALWVAFGLIGYPLVNDASSARALMQRVGSRIGPAAELGLVAWKEQNLLMADRPATTFGFSRPPAAQWADAINWQRQAPATRWLLVDAAARGRCVDATGALDMGVANRRRWWLVPAAAVACR